MGFTKEDLGLILLNNILYHWGLEVELTYISTTRWPKYWYSDLLREVANTGIIVRYIYPEKWYRHFWIRASNDCVEVSPVCRVSKRFIGFELRQYLGRITNISAESVVITNNLDICLFLREALSDNVTVGYHIYDKFSEYGNKTQLEKERFDRREECCIRKASLVLCASQRLYQDAIKLNKNSFWLPNGVPSSMIKDHLPGHHREFRRVGIITNELNRMNAEIIIELARLLPEYTLEIIGKNNLFNHPQKLPSNILLVGHVPFNSLRQYTEKWTAGLAPYKMNRFNEYCCPLKYYEYSALGLPIISTSIPEARILSSKYSNHLIIADTPQAFADSIHLVSQRRNMNYTSFACENSWRTRSQQLLEYLNSIK